MQYKIMLKQILILLLFSFSLTSFAENVKGRVFEIDDNGKSLPLPGVNVLLSGTTIGTATNGEGFFNLTIEDNNNPILVFSFVGYKTDSVDVTGKTSLDVTLIKGEELDEVKIVQRTKATSVSKINPLYVQKISGKELARCACCNLSESFETNASVDVSYADAISGVKQIKMLGLSGRYSQMLMENIPILRVGESAFGLEYTPGTWMESIQVSKGTAAVKNGYESITGQINLQYKEPEGLEKLNFYTYANQDGKAETNFNYSIPINEKWNTMIMLHGEGNFREMDLNEDGFRDKPRTLQGNIMNRWSYQGENLVFKFGFSYLDESRKGGQLDFNHDIPASSQDAYGIGIDANRFSAFSKLGFVFDRPQTSLGWITSYSRFDRESFYGLRDYDIKQHNLYTNLIFQSYLGDTRHSYNLGVSLVSDNIDENFDGSDLGYNEAVPGAFVEYTWLPSDKFTLLGGLRYDYSTRFGGFYTPRVHLKYDVAPTSKLRLSAGKGYRTANAVTENTNLLASSRSFVFGEDIKQENAWNYGASLTNEFDIAGRPLDLVLDFYRTDFKNQLVVDLDQDAQSVFFYNLDGKSYSNSFQVEAAYELFRRFDLTGAFRVNDVKTTYTGGIQEVPMVSRYKGLLSGSYRTNLDKWQFDLTAQFNGIQRLPFTGSNTPANQRPNESDSYTILMGQVTKNYRNWSFYVGAENITNYTQDNAIVSADDPFGSEFDASMVWAPLYGRMFYFGVKFSLDKK
jgi:outer membrane receptor protein involved in Fe transport